MYSCRVNLSAKIRNMNIIKAILRDFITYFKPTTRVGRIRLGVAMLMIAILAVVVLGNGQKPEDAPIEDRGVKVESVANLNGSSDLELVGTVKAVDQATIQTEASGLVTRVNVKLGDQVVAGTILATLENDSEYAALLQAEGAYEAALANATQSGFSVAERQEALNSAVATANSSYRSAFVTTENVMEQNVGDYFTASNQLVFDLQDYLGEKKQIEFALDDWQDLTASTLTADAVSPEFWAAESIVERTTNLVDILFAAVVDDESGASPTRLAELAILKSELTTARTSLANAKANLESARLAVTNAKSALERAEVASTGGSASAADAQVKQALGSLRSAQANYNKTILRTPVAGEVQVLNIDAGDFVGMNILAATVANQSALEITTFVSQNERNRIAVGDSVELAGGATGVITAIAPALDPSTGKIAVKIGSADEALTNGDTVRLTIRAGEESTIDPDQPIIVPITALKVETDRTIVFTITNEGKLVANPVETGSLLGSEIVIKDGLDLTMSIVIDARGLNEGDVVSVLNT